VRCDVCAKGRDQANRSRATAKRSAARWREDGGAIVRDLFKLGLEPLFEAFLALGWGVIVAGVEHGGR
jgi:hypothetical protein